MACSGLWPILLVGRGHRPSLEVKTLERITTRLRALKSIDMKGTRGQLIAIFAIALPVMLALGATTVDAGGWWVKSRKAQSAADAAALAAALELPAGDAAGAANSSVATNLPDATGVDVSPPYCDSRDPGCGLGASNNDIRVTVHVDAPSFFAKSFGIGPVAITKTAVASRGTVPTGLFASSTDCSSIKIPGSDQHIVGTAFTDGGFDIPGSDNSANVAMYAGSCPPLQGSQDSSNFSPIPVKVPSLDFPVSYDTGDIPCTFVSSNISFANDATASGVYCTTGNIQIRSGVHGTATFVAHQISISGSDTNFTPAWNHLLMFATGNQSNAVAGSGSIGTWTGNIYAPHGGVAISGSSTSVYNGFVEAQKISVSGSGLTLNATGPPLGPTVLIE